MPLKIHPDQQVGLKKLITLDDQCIDQILDILKISSPCLQIKQIATSIASNINYEPVSDIEEILDVVMFFYKLHDLYSVPIPELVKDIDKAISNTESLIDVYEGNEGKTKTRLLNFLNIDHVFGMIEETFNQLVQQWRTETRGISSSTELILHPAYQQIIGLGKEAIPLLLRELEKKSGRWFWALKSISREDPVLPAQQGKTKEMIQAWLDWGRKNGYQW